MNGEARGGSGRPGNGGDLGARGDEGRERRPRRSERFPASDPQTAQHLRERLGLRAVPGGAAADPGRAPRDPAFPRSRYNGTDYNAAEYKGTAYRGGEHDGSGYDRPGYGDAPYRGAAAAAYGSQLVQDRPESPWDRPRTEPGRRPGPGRSGSRRGGGGYGGGQGGGGPDGRGGGFRNWLLYGRWWRHWTWKKAVAVLTGAFLAVVVLIGAGVLYAYSKTAIPTDVAETAVEQSSDVYFSNGRTPVGSFNNGTNRQLLTSAQISPILKRAVIAAEDRHFYTEGGISITGTARAAFEDVFGGGGLQGGSTITQQFVRNYYATIGTEQTMSRKIKEIFVAIKLAHQESKDWILTQYLNTVYFGDGSSGIGAAAQAYFNRPALKLTIAQSAMLAAMINQPSYFKPGKSAGAPYQALVQRWHYVLTNMVRDGAITKAQANAQQFPRIVGGPVNDGWSGYRGYIMQAVLGELKSTYGLSQQQVYSRGLRIVTTINESMMNALQRAVKQNLRAMRADGRALPKWANIGAVLEKPGTGAILAMYPGQSFSARHQWNEALQAREQVGSSFKPYVLSTAVQQGMNVQTSKLDGDGPLCVPTDYYPTVPSMIPPAGGACPPSKYGYYLVHNDYEGDVGPISVVNASAASINSAYTDVWHRVGGQQVVNMAKLFGVNVTQAGLVPGPVNKNGMIHEAGMALGQASLSVEEQTTMFASLAGDGTYATPHVIAHLTEGARVIPLKITKRQVFTNPSSAADVDYALSFDNQPGGTAYPSAAWDRPIIAKTGTTNTAQSAFFIGAIPQYALGVGMFTANQTASTTQSLDKLPPLNGQGGGFGGTWPATIWHTFMSQEFSGLPVKPLPTPNYAGYSTWIQVKPQPAPKPQVVPHPSPSAHCWPGNPQCGSPSPSPTPTFTGPPSPSPSPSCSYSFGQPPCTSPSPSPTPSTSTSPGPIQPPARPSVPAAANASIAAEAAKVSARRRATG